MKKRVIYFNSFVVIMGFEKLIGSYSLIISNNNIESPIFDSINLGSNPKLEIDHIKLILTGIGCFIPDSFWAEMENDKVDESSKFEVVNYSNNGDFSELNGSELALIVKKNPLKFLN